MLFNCIRMEQRKLKHSHIWLVFLVIPIIPAVLGAGNYLNNLADGISMVIATIDVSVPSFVLCVLAMLYSSSGMYDLRAGCVHYTFDAF